MARRNRKPRADRVPASRRDLRRAGIVLSALLVLSAVAAIAIWQRGGEPEDQARKFVETLVREPQATEKLRALANRDAGDPQGLLSGMPARIAVRYLRAREAQGATLKFSARGIQRPEERRRIVVVYAITSVAGVTETGEVRLQVLLTADAGGWRIDGVSAGD